MLSVANSVQRELSLAAATIVVWAPVPFVKLNKSMHRFTTRTSKPQETRTAIKKDRAFSLGFVIDGGSFMVNDGAKRKLG